MARYEAMSEILTEYGADAHAYGLRGARHGRAWGGARGAAVGAGIGAGLGLRGAGFSAAEAAAGAEQIAEEVAAYEVEGGASGLDLEEAGARARATIDAILGGETPRAAEVAGAVLLGVSSDPAEWDDAVVDDLLPLELAASDGSSEAWGDPVWQASPPSVARTSRSSTSAAAPLVEREDSGAGVQLGGVVLGVVLGAVASRVIASRRGGGHAPI